CGGDRAVGAGAVRDDDRLTPTLFKLAAAATRDDIGRSAGRETYEEAPRRRRVGLRPRDARHRRQRGNARGQLQKISAGKFHFELPSPFHITPSPLPPQRDAY